MHWSRVGRFGMRCVGMVVVWGLLSAWCGAGVAIAEEEVLFLKDIGDYPEQLTVAGDTLYFTAGSSDWDWTEPVLWKTDGTTEGTQIVQDFRVGHTRAHIKMMTAVGNILYFWLSQDTSLCHVYQSDGTAEGTHVVGCTTPENTYNASRYANIYLSAWNGYLYFGAKSNLYGNEMWRTDGTPDGTVLLKDIVPGSGSSGAAGLFSCNGIGYFSTTYDDGSSAMWKTDGTEAGTELLKQIRMRYVRDYAVMNRKVYFCANDDVHWNELWVTDGTTDGTYMVADINTQAGFLPPTSEPTHITEMGGRLYFSAYTPDAGIELWTSDGTAEGTRMVKDINPIVPSLAGIGRTIDNIRAADGLLFFCAHDEVTGKELWVSDGTEAGTHLVKDFNPNPINPGSDAGGAYILDIVIIKGDAYFVAYDGDNYSLWRSDGSASGTKKLYEGLTKLPLAGYLDQYFPHIQCFKGKVYFPAYHWGLESPGLWALHIAPYVSSLVVSGDNPTNAAEVTFTATFSEAVSGVDATDFSLVTAGVSGAAITGIVVDSDTTATVSVNTGTGDGTIQIRLTDDDSIKDADDVPLEGPRTLVGDFAGETCVIDRTRPIPSLTISAPDPAPAAPIPVAVHFTEAVTGLSIEDFVVSGGVAQNLSGSGADYSVEIQPSSSAAATITVELPAERVRDAAGNASDNASLVLHYAPVEEGEGGTTEGATEAESPEGEGEGDGVLEGEGEGDGVLEGEGEGDGALEGEGEGDGALEGEGEGVACSGPETVTLGRTVKMSYTAGGTLDITIRLDYGDCDPLTQLMLRETLPTGWSYVSMPEAIPMVAFPSAGTTGVLEFAWMSYNMPDFPAEFTYRVQVPAEQTGEVQISGQAEYWVEGSIPSLFSETVVSHVLDPATAHPHTADQDGNGVINLTELLRVIQFFNLRGFYCVTAPVTSEDGYLPGSGTNQSCAPHQSDYNPQDWKISLTELMRLIQFFNLRGYHPCPGTGTEDDYCPGA